MSSIHTARSAKEVTIYDSPTFDQDFRIHVDEAIGSASIAPSGRDVVLASQQGLHIIDLDAPYSPPRHLRHQTPWTPADVQWSPFASRYYWIVSTSNQRALVWNLELSSTQAPIEHTLHAHSRAITDINFSAFHQDMLATCAVDAFVHCWDLRTPTRPVVSFSDWSAGATQVKWNRQDSHIIASSHDRFLHIWDDRKGALPLKTIEAHETKIYGLDWNRIEASKILTCSLDRSIKLWDYNKSESEPERVIYTPFPVWRARHTPFGNAILAMPQRGNNSLHLYHQQPQDASTATARIETVPNYSFSGHGEQVKEFLWRARGTIDDNVDDRDFQLVSWGADHELILHRMGDRQLRAAGYQKGMRIERNWTLTRRGAPYRSFRDKSVPQFASTLGDVPQNPTARGLEGAYTGTSPGMNKAPIPVAGGWTGGGSVMTYSGMETRNAKEQDEDLIGWMKGVKFGKRGPSMSDRRKSRRLSVIADLHTMNTDSTSETLSDEIVHVGERFTKIDFEEADVGARHVKVCFNGPWGSDSKLVFVQLSMDFPQHYPEEATPTFHLEPTSALPEERVAALESDLKTIATGYLIHRRGCLEAILSYLLGERDLEESIDWLTHDDGDALESTGQAESSSDDEDGLLLGDNSASEMQSLDMEGSGILSTNANVPLPRYCGALWSANGKLVCFFPPKEEPRSMLRQVGLAGSGRTRNSREIFAGFGRLHTDSPDTKLRSSSVGGSESDGSNDEYTSSSSSSSSSSGGSDILPNRFHPPAAWHGGSLRFAKVKTHSTDGSMPTTNDLGRKAPYVKRRTVVAMHDFASLLPSKRLLAEEFAIFGDGPTLCSHNARIADSCAQSELSDIWELLKLILQDDVPLSILPIQNRDEDIRVVAHRALVRIKRKDSGLDLSFDEPDHVSNPFMTSTVKWGNHPFSQAWLISSLFDYFEKIADLQMLAMLACVLAQTVGSKDEEGFPISASSMNRQDSMETPAQSLNYFSSEEAALYQYGPTISVSASPHPPETPVTVYGSMGSSEGKRKQDQLVPSSEPTTPYSMDNPPSMPLSRASTYRSNTGQSLSTSPEQQKTSFNSAGSFAANLWARPFNLASSPPTRQRLSGDDLSSSTPPSSGITWAKGTRTTHRSDSTIRKRFLSQEDDDEGSSTEEDEPLPRRAMVAVKLKNQGMFDEEACTNVPYLDAERTSRLAAYRNAYAHLLDAWGLKMQRSEMLKYNGIFAATSQAPNGDQSSKLGLGMINKITETVGPHVVRCCMRCSNVDLTSRLDGPTTACLKCGTKSRLLRCTICLEPIKRLYKVCLSCGHAAHAACQQALLEGCSDDEQVECDTGCGCSCAQHATMSGAEVMPPEPWPREPSLPDFGYRVDKLQQPSHSSLVSRRDSTAEGRRAAGLALGGRPGMSRIDNANLRRTRTRSFGQ